MLQEVTTDYQHVIQTFSIQNQFVSDEKPEGPIVCSIWLILYILSVDCVSVNDESPFYICNSNMTQLQTCLTGVSLWCGYYLEITSSLPHSVYCYLHVYYPRTCTLIFHTSIVDWVCYHVITIHWKGCKYVQPSLNIGPTCHKVCKFFL